MKKVVVANVVVALLFAVAPHLPVAREQVTLEEATSAFAWMITIGSILYLFTSTTLLWMSAEEKSELVRLRESIATYVQGPWIEAVRDDEFYRTFLGQVHQAESTVRISYLGNHHPTVARRDERNAYYASLLSAMRKNERVVFRRLLRDTPANRTWARSRLEDWIGLPNVSVALLPDSREAEEMPLALSVQVVDERITWFVAVEGHEWIGPHRDLRIDDPTTAVFISKYHDRLWQKAVLIVEAGNLTEEGGKLSLAPGAVDA